MAFSYPVAEYLHHQKVWQAKYHTIETVRFGNTDTFLGKDDSTMADVLRIRFMMLSEGVSPTEEGKKGKVFHFVQMFLGHHLDALFKAGLITIHDGVNAVVLTEAGIAIHDAFNSETPPMPKTVSIDSVIAAAKRLRHPPNPDIFSA